MEIDVLKHIASPDVFQALFGALLFAFILARPSRPLGNRDASLTKSNRWALFWHTTFLSFVEILFIIDLWDQESFALGIILLIATIPINGVAFSAYYFYLSSDETPDGVTPEPKKNEKP